MVKISDSDSCKWCDQGKCWDHGQIEKPAGHKDKGAKGKAPNWMQQMAKGAKGKGKGKMLQLLGALGQMMAGQFEGEGEGKKQSAAAISWVAQISQAYAKTHREVMNKETILYEFEKSEEGFTCNIACDKFNSVHQGEGASQKEAKEAVAKTALETEFPDFYAEALKRSKGQAQRGAQADPARSQAQRLLPWRSQLAQAYSKKNQGMTKGEISYATETKEDAEKMNKFVATVSSDKFEKSYTGEPGQSKGDAMDNAAMAAMKAEFPEAFAASKSPTTKKGFNKLQKKVQKAEKEADEACGEKRKAERLNDDPKSTFNRAMMAIKAGTPLTKDMISYSTVEKDGKTVATVAVTGFGPTKKFSGAAVDGTTQANKKEAEGKAAEAAHKAFKKQIDKAQAEQVIKRAAKDEQKKSDWAILLASKKEKLAAQKAEKAKAKA